MSLALGLNRLARGLAGGLGGAGGGGGAPAVLYSDDFSSDTSGEWTIGQNAVDISASVAGGALVITRGAADSVNARMVREVTGLTIGRSYTAVGDVGGDGVPLFGVSESSVGGGGGAANLSVGATGTIELSFTAPATTAYIVAGFAGAAESDQMTLDNVSLTEGP